MSVAVSACVEHVRSSTCGARLCAPSLLASPHAGLTSLYQVDGRVDRSGRLARRSLSSSNNLLPLPRGAGEARQTDTH